MKKILVCSLLLLLCIAIAFVVCVEFRYFVKMVDYVFRVCYSPILGNDYFVGIPQNKIPFFVFSFTFAAFLLFFLIREFVRYFRGNSIKYEVRYSYEQFKAWKEEEIAKRNAKKEETRKRKMQERKEKLQKELQDMEEAP